VNIESRVERPANMSKHSRIAILFTVLAIAVLSSCTGSDLGSIGNVAADRFVGSAPVNVSGPDADNGTVVSIADDMVTGRRFDLTPSGFAIASGDVSSTAPAGSDFGVAGGTLDVSGDNATVDLDVFSTNPDVTNAHMAGTFSLSEATQALTNPGDSFIMDWAIDFDYLGFPVQLDVQQELTGSDFQNLDE
jgi:hypothetical protein